MSSRRRGRPRRGGNSTNPEPTSGSAKRKLRHEGSGFEAWGGYMQAKMQKLNDQFNKDSGESGSEIFKGIHVYVNGYTKPSSDELRRLLTLHGGTYEQYLYRTRVTHIVAINLPDSKVRELKGMKVVRPEWITESVSAGKLLPYTNYQLYTAQTKSQHGLNSYAKTSILTRSSSVSSTASSALDSGQPGRSRSTRSNPVVMLDLDLDLENSSEDNSDEDLSNLRIKDIENELNASYENSSDSKSENQTNIIKRSLHSAESLTGSYHDKSPGKMAKAGDSNFLSEFYTHSRLHHISTWGAEYRAYVTQLQKQSDGAYPGRERLRQFHQDNVAKTGVESSTWGAHGGKPKKVIMHVDMDCFFVSVGLLDKPELRGRPVAVTHSKGKGGAKETPGSDFNFEKTQWKRKRQQGGKKGRRSNQPTDTTADSALDLEEEDVDNTLRGGTDVHVTKGSAAKETFHSMADIASCSYEARKTGVKNGMSMGQAKKLCPDLVTIPYNFDKYQQVSRTLYDTVASFTHDIEAVSCDEMLVDCTDLLADTGGTPEEFATLLRREIHDKSGCNASAGLSGSILLARLATRSAKPNGQFYLTTDDVPEFITKQSIRDLPGVGYSMTHKLNTMSVTTCGDLQKLSLPVLQKEFGPKTGQSLYNYCRGQDERQIKMEKERKSVSAEINYGIRFQRDGEAEKFLVDLSEEVSTRLKNINMRGKTITLKVMVRRSDAPKETAKFMGHGICNNVSKSSSLPVATDNGKVIAKECIALLQAMKVSSADLRGIGIQTHRLESTVIGSSSSGGGNQSILNFAVPKPPSSVQTSTSKSPTSSKSDVRISKPKLQTDKSSSRQVDEEFDVEFVDDFGVGGQVQDDDDDETIVFSCSSGPIQEELSRRKAAKNELPPLPSLPSFGTPPETPRTKQTVQSQSEPQDYFPSPSQIDPEVLKELPPDIRAQIEKDMATKRADSKATTSATAAPANQNKDEVPGCSHWPSQEDRSANEDTVPDSPELGLSPVRDEETGSVEALPSLSQIDMSCLNALPEDLQEEIRSEYARQGQTTEPQPDETRPPALQLQQAKSPSKTRESPRKSPSKSPGRGKKNSPVFKVPKGRPVGSKNKKLSPKKLDFMNQTKLTSNTAVKENAYKSPKEDVYSIDLKPLQNLDKTLTDVQILEPSVPVPEPTVTPTGTDTAEDTVNLCGAVSIQEVRELLAEWLESCPVPQEEDVKVMLEYLGQLVLDHNLEQVDLVLKFLNRKIKKLANQLWRQSFKNILSNTQEVVKSVHGCSLNVDWLTAR